MADRPFRRHWLAFAALAAATAFGFQGARGLFETTEGRYAECGRVMVATGNYLEPQLDGRPHWTKPPLTYWVISGSLKLFGRNEFGARFANAFSFLLTCLVVAALGATLWGRAAGIAAGLVYATSPFPAAAASTISTDMILTLFVSCAVLCYFKAARTKKGFRTLWTVALWSALGLGFMTKGPPALLPLVPMAIWHQRVKPGFKLFAPAGLLVFVVIGLPWYLLMCVRHPGLLSYFLGEEVVARVSTDSFNRNPEWYVPFVLYVPLLTLGAGPWFYAGWKLLAERRFHVLSRLWQALSGREVGAFLLLWLLLPLGIFFVSQSRLPLYVLPIYAPVALAVGRWLTRSSPAGVPKRVWWIAAITAALLIGLKGVSSRVESRMNMGALQAMVREAGGETAIAYVFNQNKLYGLKFYLDGRMGRMTLSGREDWADSSVERVARTVREARRPRRHVLVARDYDLPTFSRAWEDAGMGLTCRKGSRWAVCSPRL